MIPLYRDIDIIVTVNVHDNIYPLKNSLAIGAALFKMVSVKKVVKLKGWPRNGCDGIN